MHQDLSSCLIHIVLLQQVSPSAQGLRDLGRQELLNLAQQNDQRASARGIV